MPPLGSQAVSAHCAITDPAKAEGTYLEQGMAFIEALRHAKPRIDLFRELPMSALDQAGLSARLDEIAQVGGA